MFRSINIQAYIYLVALFYLSVPAHAWAAGALILDNQSQLYHINSAPESSGFFPIPDTVTEAQLWQYAINKHTFDATTRPNFKQHKRYGLYVELENDTQTQRWLLHISHYLVKVSHVYIQSGDGAINQFSNQSNLEDYEQINGKDSGIDSGINNGIDNGAVSPYQTIQFSPQHQHTNMLGRAMDLELNQQARSRLLIILNAEALRQPIYVGLLSEHAYAAWSKKMDFTFTLSIGIVCCFILLSLFCYVIARDQTFLWFAISTALILFISVLRSNVGIGFIDTSQGLPFWVWITVGAMQISILMFVKSFLSLATHSKSSTFVKVVVLIIIATMVISLFSNGEFNGSLFAFSSLLVMMFVIVMGVLKAKHSGSIYIVFMLGWLPLLYAAAISVLNQHTLPNTNEITLSYHNVIAPYFQVLHFFIHFVAIVLRVVAIKKEKLAAEVKSEAKSTFLAQLSHDLRQPIDAMGLMLEHLNDQPNTDQGKHLLTKAQRLQRGMLDTFSSLSNLAQVESGKLKVNLQHTKIADVFDDVLNEHQLMFQHKQLSLKCVLGNHLKASNYELLTDRILLRRIVNNLVSNAFKYTKQGGVLVCARLRKNTLVIQVWDTGLGIPVHKLNDIFDMYAQANESQLKNNESDTKEAYTGAGIGLATVKHLTDLLSYQLTVQSKVDSGSVFTVSIPLIHLEQREGVHQRHQRAANIQAERTEIKGGTATKTRTYSSNINIVNAIHSAQLSESVTALMMKWDYSFVVSHILSAFRSAHCVLIQADDKAMLCAALKHKNPSVFLQTHPHLFIVCLSSSASLASDLQAQVGANNFQTLPYPVNPAQLRSLLCYFEANLIE